MTLPTDSGAATTAMKTAHLRLESRPSTLVAAQYTTLPFPGIGPRQEVVFDLGITAMGGGIEVQGLVLKGYHGHQLLFEQRWPARILRAHTGEPSLSVAAGTGLALRTLHVLLHAYEPLTMVEATVVAQPAANQADSGDNDRGDNDRGDDEQQSTQAVLQIPVIVHERQTDLHFPLRGAWWAIQAADWSDQHKQEAYSQPFALDLVKLGADNRFFSGNGMALDDHYSWDQPVYATAGGKISMVIADMPDLAPGAQPDAAMFGGDATRLLGNAIALSHANGEFSYFGHLRQGSLAVREGDMVWRGALLGHVGNSGSSPGATPAFSPNGGAKFIYRPRPAVNLATLRRAANFHHAHHHSHAHGRARADR